MPINSNSTQVNQYIPDFRLEDLENGQILVYDLAVKAFRNSDGSDTSLTIGSLNLADFAVHYNHFSASDGVAATPGTVLAVGPAGDTKWAALVDTVITDPALIPLGTLFDVDTSTATANDKIVFNGTNWVATADDIELNDITYVTINSPELAGQVLKANGANDWTNEYLNIPDLGDVDGTITPADGGILVYNTTSSKWEPKLVVVEDLNVAAGALDGDMLVWNNTTSEWTPTSINSIEHSLDSLSDVTIATAVDGQVLQYNSTSSEWENSSQSWNDLIDVPAEFAPAPHSYTLITDFVSGLTTNNNVITFKNLSEVEVLSSYANKILVWDAAGTTLTHVDTIDASYITGIDAADVGGLATVATSGSFNSLVHTDDVMMKVGSPTINNLISQAGDGQAIDAGVSALDFATAAQGTKADSALQGTDSINALSDVDTTTATPTTGNGLVWDGVNWTPSAVSTVGVISDLSDVSSAAPVDNSVLTWNTGSGEWEPALANTSVELVLGDLLDATITNPLVSQHLRWSGSQWVNGPLDYNEIYNKPDHADEIHSHPTSDITDFTADVDARNSSFTFVDLADTDPAVPSGYLRWNGAGDTVVYSAIIPVGDVNGLATIATSGLYTDLVGTPTTFAPSVHGHAISEVTGLQADLDALELNKADKIIPSAVGNLAGLDAAGNLLDSGFVTGDFALTAHVHNAVDIAGLNLNALSDTTVTAFPAADDILKYNGTTWINEALDYSEITNVPIEFTPVTHFHSVSEITDFTAEVDARNSSFTFVNLADTNASVAGNEFLRWNGAGTEIIYQGQISALTDVFGLSTVATTGDYNDLANLPAVPSNGDFDFVGLGDTDAVIVADGFLRWNATGTQISYSTTIDASDLTGLATVATSGDYTDLINAPAIPTNNSFSLTGLSDTSNITVADGFLRWNAGGTNVTYTVITASDITGLATVASTGDYDDLNNLPTSVDWNDIVGEPAVWTPDVHIHSISDITLLQSTLDAKQNASAAFSGDYNDLANAPAIPANNDFTIVGLGDTNNTAIANGILRWNAGGTQVNYVGSIDASDLTGLATVATTGSYNDLVDTPTTFAPASHTHTTGDITGLGIYALDGDISLVGKTNDYNDLDNLPPIPANGDFDFVGLGDTVGTAIANGFVRWNGAGTLLTYQSTISVSDITGLATVATSGAFSDINEVNASPTAVNDLLTWDGAEWIALAGVREIVNLDDVQDTPVANAYLRWNTDANEVIFEENLDAVNISGLAVVATTGSIFDLKDVEADAIAPGQLLAWDGSDFVPVSQSAGGPGGSSTLDALTDTLLIGGGSIGQALVAISVDGTGKPDAWQNQNIDYTSIVNAPTNATYSLTGLSDTNASALANGYLLWNAAGTQVNYSATIPGTSVTGLGAVAYSNEYSSINNRIVDIEDLGNVSSNLPANGNALVWNSTASEWEPQTLAGGGTVSLDDITDVSITTATSGEVLSFNGSIWVNYVLTPADVSGLATVATSGDYTDLINTPANTVVGLNDSSGTVIADGYLRWNAAGDTVIYTTIDASDLTGLATVATSGDYADLINAPAIPENDDFTVVGLSDTEAVAISDTFLVWNDGGTLVEYQEYPVLKSEWNVVATSITLANNTNYSIDTTLAGFTVTFPGTVSVNDHIRLVDFAGTFGTNTLTIDPNGNPLNGAVTPIVLNSDRIAVEYTYLGGVEGWVATADANVGAAGGNWPPVWTVITAAQTAVSESAFMVDTTLGPITVTFPLAPAANAIVKISDYAGTFRTNPLTIDRNGELINGVAQDIIISRDYTTGTFTYVDSTVGWRPTQISAVSLSDSGNNWVIINSNTTAISGDELFVDTNSSEVDVTLPANPVANDVIRIADLFGTAGSNRILVVANGNKIMNNVDDLEITNLNASIELTYVNASFGWKITDGLGELLAAGNQIETAVDIYVSTTGNDSTGTGSAALPFLTVHRALEWTEQILIGSAGSIVINVEAGIYSSNSPLEMLHPNGDKIAIIGEQTTANVSITGLDSSAPTAIQLAISDASNLSINDYVKITGTTGTGSHLLVEGVFKVASVGASSITINPGYSQSLPVFTLAGGVVTRHDTVLSFTASPGYVGRSAKLGGMNNLVLAGDGSGSHNGVTVGTNAAATSSNSGGSAVFGNTVSIHGFGGTGIEAAGNGFVNAASIVISQCDTGIVITASGVVNMPGGVISYNSNSGINGLHGSVNAIGATVAGNGQGVLAKSGAGIDITNGAVITSIGSALEISYGGTINAVGAEVDTTNDAGTLGSIVVAIGAGSIRIEDAGTSNVEVGVTFNPAYGTQDVINNGVAYIGNV